MSVSPHHVALKDDAEKAVANGANQKWHFDSKSGFITGFDGRVLDVNGGSAAAGTKVIVFDKKPNDNLNQQWEYKDGSFYSKMGTNFVIDINGGTVANGTDLILWPHHGGPNQKWDIDHFGFIRSRANPNFGIDISGGQAAKGPGKVILWTLAATAAQSAVAKALQLHQHQRWHYDAKTGFLTGFDGRVLDVNGGAATQGTKLILWPKKAADNLNQQWDFKDGHFISRMNTKFVIDINGGTYANGTGLILWPPHGGPNQKWDMDQYGFIRSRGNAAFCIDVQGGAIPAAAGAGTMQIFTCLHMSGGKI